MRTRILTLLTAAVLAVCPPLAAELTPHQKTAAEAAMRDFTAAEFTARQQAVDKLVEIGPDVIPLVRALHDGTTDAEVKLRCEMALKRIGTRWGVIADPAAPNGAAVVNLGPSRVTIDELDVMLADAVEALARASGNAPVVVPQNLTDRPAPLRVKDALYWDAVDAMCRATGTMLGADPTTGKITLLDRDGPPGPAVTAGPLLLTFNGGSVSRAFRVVKRPGARPSDTSTLSYNGSAWWESRLDVFNVTIAFTKALAGGKSLFEGIAPPSILVAPSAPGRCYGPLLLYFPRIPEGLRRIDSLEGVAKVTTRLGEKTVRLDDILAGGNREATAGGMTLALKNAAERRNGSLTMTVSVRREGGNPNMRFSSEGGPASFELVDPKGQRYVGFIEGGHLGAKKTGRKGKNGLDETAEEGDLTLHFINLPDLPGAWALVLAWPEKLDTREYPFAMKDVPVP